MKPINLYLFLAYDQFVLNPVLPCSLFLVFFSVARGSCSGVCLPAHPDPCPWGCPPRRPPPFLCSLRRMAPASMGTRPALVALLSRLLLAWVVPSLCYPLKYPACLSPGTCRLSTGPRLVSRWHSLMPALPVPSARKSSNASLMLSRP